MRDMMRRLSQLTSHEVDQLKEQFELFKKLTAGEVKKAWKEVESHERELNRQQEMYRSMLSEYYSLLESKKAMELHTLRASDGYTSPNLNESKLQTMNISHINIGKLNLSSTKKGKRKTLSKRTSQELHHQSMYNSKKSKSSMISKFPSLPKHHNMPSTSLNFSPSIRNNSEMRDTMKGILTAEEKQYQILRKFVKHSSPGKPHRHGNVAGSDFRPSMLQLQLAANINESKLNASQSDIEAYP